MTCIIVEVSDLDTVYCVCGSSIYMHAHGGIWHDMMKTTIDLVCIFIKRLKFEVS